MDTNKILDLIKQNGPALPVEIASSLGVDSFLAKAILSELVSSGQLKTSDPVGGSYLYFVDGQESEAKRKVESLVGQVEKRVKTFAKKVEDSPELAKKREHFAKHFEKSIIEKEKPKSIEKPKVIPKPLPNVPKRQPISFVKDMFKKTVTQKASFVDLALDYLKKNVEITEEVGRKRTEAGLLARIPSSVGAVSFFIKVRGKKRITEADLSLAYTEGLKYNAPTLFVTNGKLSKLAKEYAEGLKGFLKIKQL